jgi:glycosyltransferase involved in cell wall biosynthesis
MRFHVVGLPHLPVRREFSACAFTARTYKFCEMMLSNGHEVRLYSIEGSDAPCSQRIDIAPTDWRYHYFGDYDCASVGYARKGFAWDTTKPYWREFNEAVAREIKPQREFVCIVGGTCQKPLIEAIRGEFIPVETCVGYLGSFAPFQVFESYAQMHHVYGRNSGHLPHGCDGRNFDAVIPGSYHLEDFPFNAKPADYVVYVGRITERKGVAIAVEAARRANTNIILCGQGEPVTTEPHAQYVGHVNAVQRAAVMANAKAILVPSLYLEPFGGVNVEAQLCGTPAITSDWGAFPETVEHGVSGYRCRTLEQWVWAIQNVHKLDRLAVAERARRLYSLERIAGMYQEYFEMLDTLWGAGWYAEKARTELNWLKGS